jgi:DNA repair photolyase
MQVLTTPSVLPALSAETYFKGRGAQINTANKFVKQSYVQEHPEVLDEPFLQKEKTEIIYTWPKTVINKVESDDLGFEYSLNPYQGCEHGCIYCYARNTHEYWGYSAGLDFERKILVKKNVIEVLEKTFSKKKWKVSPIMLSGNTDCYQPIERDLEMTRNILKTCLKYKHPVAIVTKNSLIKRDIDILARLAEENLVQVMISMTGSDEKIRQLMEPRTSTYKSRLEVIETFSKYKIPTGIMLAPIIPGINSQDIPKVLEQAGNAGAMEAGMSIVRLNGAVGDLFKDWLFKNFPYRADKVWTQICDCHGGTTEDSRFGVRMRGEGKIAESIQQMFKLYKSKFIQTRENFQLNCSSFNYKANEVQLSLF